MAATALPDGARAKGDVATPEGTGVPRSRTPWWVALGSLAVLCVPLIVALVHFKRAPWTPVLDLAMTELRVRDVGSGHTPLIGLPGRIGPLERQGSHPGPLSFYALAPTYRLLGSTAWSLQVGTFLVHAVAMAAALAIAVRRGGTQLVVVVAAVLALLVAGYGGGTLTEPWNPYLPLMWWVVVLLAAWSVLSGDLPMLPVVVIAGSFCAQTHVPYLALSLGIGGLVTLGAVLAGRDPEVRARALRWSLAAAGVGVLLWLPPTIDQVRHDPGNYRLLVEHFSDPPEEPVGLGEGVDVGLGFLDAGFLVRADVEGPSALVTASDADQPSTVRGAILLVVWAAAAAYAIARRRHDRPLLALHAVVGAGVALMVVSISRIFGVVWYYLTLWGWALGLLALVAVGWTLATAVADRRPDLDRMRAGRVGTVALGVLALGVVLRFTLAAADSAHADPNVASELALVVDDVGAGLRAGAGDATGTDGRYLITWSDAFHIGSQGFGLLNELERDGFDVGLQVARHVPATDHRVLEPAAATARIHLATGVFIERYAAIPGAVVLAEVDPRTPAERAEQEQLRVGVIADLRAMGYDELVPEVDENLFGAAIDGRLPDELRERMGRMLEIGAPLAVLVVPMDTPDL